MSGLQGCVIRRAGLGRSVVDGSREASVASALQPRIPRMDILCCIQPVPSTFASSRACTTTCRNLRRCFSSSKIMPRTGEAALL